MDRGIEEQAGVNTNFTPAGIVTLYFSHLIILRFFIQFPLLALTFSTLLQFRTADDNKHIFQMRR